MIQFVPVKGKTEDYEKQKDVIYLDDSTGKSMTEKYDHATRNFIKKPGWYCFRHNDLYIETPIEEVEWLLNNRVGSSVAVCGVMGTLNLEHTMNWWFPHREVNGAGMIKQTILKDGVPDKDGKSYVMRDWPGYHEGLATVDGCVMFIHSKLFAAGAAWDTNIIDYHYYDVDICLQALEHSFGVATVPVLVRHDSAGNAGTRLDELRKYPFDKWNRKVSGLFPINKFSTFIE